MPGWAELRRFLNHHGVLKRTTGRHYIYLYKGRIIRVSKSSGEIGSKSWQDILKHQLRITQEEFNRG